MKVRRTADPSVVRQLYEAIDCIRKQRQIANLHRIVKYMEREYSFTPKEILQNLHKAVIDGLVIETVTIGCKGSKTGVEQEGYWIPDADQMSDSIENDQHDWYCFNCHEPGKVLCCSSCFRVYHRNCLEDDCKNTKAFSCVWCKEEKTPNKQEQLALGKCLHFVVSQQKDYWKDLTEKPDPEEYPRYNFFVRCHYDLNMLQMDCHNCLFTTIEEFLSKARLVYHNFYVALGEDHSLTDLAKQFVEDCEREVQELKLCRNCFYLSNTKPMKDWFCKPCDPPHQVVWAKQKGFEYWPAKVIRVGDTKVDVRFFGKHHPRAWISIDSVRAISVSPTVLRVKRKPQWKQASAEMKEYIRQCECAFGKEKASKIILYDSPYGIGKNKKLVTAMIGNSKSNSSTSYTDLSESFNGAEEKATDDTRATLCDDEDGDKLRVIDEDCDVPRDPFLVDQRKRKSEDNDDEFQGKRVKTEAEVYVDDTTQMCGAGLNDKQEQVAPSELNGSECSCKLRYGTILKKFKDYVVESNRLDKGKLLRAAACKSAYDLKVAEDRIRTEMIEMYEEKIGKLKEKHEKELKLSKSRKWCRMCDNEATLTCCKNASFCSLDCKEKSMDTSPTSPQRTRRAATKIK